MRDIAIHTALASQLLGCCRGTASCKEELPPNLDAAVSNHWCSIWTLPCELEFTKELIIYDFGTFDDKHVLSGRHQDSLRGFLMLLWRTRLQGSIFLTNNSRALKAI